MTNYLRRESRALIRNIASGARTAFFSKHSLQMYHCGHDQAVWLVGFNVLLAIVGGYLTHLPDPEFSYYGIYSEVLSLGAMLFAVFLIAKILGDKAFSMRLLVVVYSIAPVFYVVAKVLDMTIEPGYLGSVSDWPVQHQLLLVWGLAVVFFIMWSVSNRVFDKAAKSFGVYFGIVALPAMYVPNWDFWYAKEPDSTYNEYEQLQHERYLYLQYDLVDGVAERLLEGTRNQADVYYVGFAGYSSQDVFMKEVMYGKDLFERRFNAGGRAVTLINNLKTVKTTPLATKTNLAMILNEIGHIMNPEEDFLFLYLTSHGSKKHKLSVTMWPYTLDQINPQDLRALLDNAGIKNRVLMVSACYSGGFIEPLKDDNTLVITAAAADKQSFGCSNENDFTYFGRALLDEHLQHDSSLLDAFNRALESIHAREKREGKTFSEPQLFIGPGIRAKLAALDRVLADRRTASATRHTYQ